ncbi:MAG TPA: 50S ribosomal protein L13 [bacterium]|nr:50S ribosomal protein L13 [bacterium]
MKTSWTKPNQIERKWYVIDAKDQILGRVATQIAKRLIGKDNVKYVPNLDFGDYVIVLNSKDVKLTRGKEKKKMYYSHSGFPGGFKEIRFDKKLAKDPNSIITLAVKRMLPKNKLGEGMINRLYVYESSEHKHEAQKPEEIKL